MSDSEKAVNLRDGIISLEDDKLLFIHKISKLGQIASLLGILSLMGIAMILANELPHAFIVFFGIIIIPLFVLGGIVSTVMKNICAKEINKRGLKTK